MMFPDFGYGETIQHLRYLGNAKDSDGYRVKGYAAAVAVENVGVDQPAFSEPRDGATEKAQADLTIFLPAGYESSSRDRFIIRGKTYEAEGDGVALRNFLTGDLYRTEVDVRRISGEE